MADVVAFHPEGLLHKFGFGDGDLLHDLVEEHELAVDHQDLLIAVVEQLIAPRLDQKVETQTLVTMHNPIRARTVDGNKADVDSTLTPRIIEVPVADIIRLARGRWTRQDTAGCSRPSAQRSGARPTTWVANRSSPGNSSTTDSSGRTSRFATSSSPSSTVEALLVPTPGFEPGHRFASRRRSFVS